MREKLLSEYLSEIEAARQLRVEARTMRSWRQRHEGPVWLRIGRKIFYSRKAITAWLQGLEQKSGSRGRRAA